MTKKKDCKPGKPGKKRGPPPGQEIIRSRTSRIESVINDAAIDPNVREQLRHVEGIEPEVRNRLFFNKGSETIMSSIGVSDSDLTFIDGGDHDKLPSLDELKLVDNHHPTFLHRPTPVYPINMKARQMAHLKKSTNTQSVSSNSFKELTNPALYKSSSSLSSLPNHSSDIPSSPPSHSSSLSPVLPGASSPLPSLSNSLSGISGLSSSLPGPPSSLTDLSTSIPNKSSSLPNASSLMPNFSSSQSNISSSSISSLLPNNSSSLPSISSLISRHSSSRRRSKHSSSRSRHSSFRSRLASLRRFSSMRPNHSLSLPVAVASRFVLSQPDHQHYGPNMLPPLRPFVNPLQPPAQNSSVALEWLPPITLPEHHTTSRNECDVSKNSKSSANVINNSENPGNECLIDGDLLTSSVNHDQARQQSGRLIDVDEFDTRRTRMSTIPTMTVGGRHKNSRSSTANTKKHSSSSNNRRRANSSQNKKKGGDVIYLALNSINREALNRAREAPTPIPIPDRNGSATSDINGSTHTHSFSAILDHNRTPINPFSTTPNVNRSTHSLSAIAELNGPTLSLSAITDLNGPFIYPHLSSSDNEASHLALSAISDRNILAPLLLTTSDREVPTHLENSNIDNPTQLASFDCDAPIETLNHDVLTPNNDDTSTIPGHSSNNNIEFTDSSMDVETITKGLNNDCTKLNNNQSLSKSKDLNDGSDYDDHNKFNIDDGSSEKTLVEVEEVGNGKKCHNTELRRSARIEKIKILECGFDQRNEVGEDQVDSDEDSDDEDDDRVRRSRPINRRRRPRVPRRITRQTKPPAPRDP
ncbi:2493_t:CDS:2, partial [Diversispora eburnea]